MKTAITLALATLAACSWETPPVQTYYIDTHYLSLLDVDLRPGVKTLTVDIFQPTRQNDDILPGQPLAKDDYTFTPIGLCTGHTAYNILPDGSHEENYTFRYTYDQNLRITSETRTDLSPTVTTTTYTYDERVATALEYTTNGDEQNPIPVSKKIYPLDANGHIIWGLSDDYLPSRATPTENGHLRVILRADSRGNWTESYLRADTPNPDIYDYTRRQITYY
ncbi:MAG: hypothetical protein LBI96_06475 [Odoribacteraceae bacterium]|jgi:hypothetical protein|nr:hypothetical protein [Odoribacteraceae bacterium]